MSLRTWRAVAGAAVLVAACTTGCAHRLDVVPASAVTLRDGAGAPAATPSAPQQGSGTGFRSVRTFRPVAVPRRLRIPAIGVDTGLDRVGLAADGTVAAPRRWQVAAWYETGPRPGQRGPAVIVGHVDSTSGPAVFYRLADLRPGDRVVVEAMDGRSVRFRVTGTVRVPKSGFPVAWAYSPTLEPSLRLVTCGGRFDRSTGHYVDNVVVTAVPA